jgi:hypothetical protein
MEKQLAQKILDYLKSNQGTPLTSNEISDNTGEDPVKVQNTLNELQSLGYAYQIRSGYWYSTLRGSKAPSTLKGTDAYSTFREVHKKLTPESRKTQLSKSKDFYTNLQSALNSYYDYFKANHPEYSKLLNYFDQSPANKEELFKEVQALMLGWDVSGHQLLAYPNNKKYVYPENFQAFEHAMDESIRRFYENMPQDRSKVKFQDEYKKTLTFVSSILPKVASLVQNDYLKTQTPGTIINFSQIRAWLNDQIASVKIPKDMDKELVFEKLFEKLPTMVNTINSVFLSTTPADIIVPSLVQSLRTTKSGVTIFNRAKSTIGNSTVMESGNLNSVFQREDYSGINLSGIDLSDLNIKEANFSNSVLKNSNWAGAVVRGCNFQNADMTFCNLDISMFTENIVQDADFDGAAISKKIKWDTNEGVPKNITISNIEYNKKDLSTILQSRPSTSYSIPLKEDQIPDAKALAKALRGILERLHTFSNKKLSWEIVNFEKTKTQVGGKKHEILQLIKDSPGGIATAKDIQALGISFQYFTQLQKDDYVARVAEGRYILTLRGEKLLTLLNHNQSYSSSLKIRSWNK